MKFDLHGNLTPITADHTHRHTPHKLLLIRYEILIDIIHSFK